MAHAAPITAADREKNRDQVGRVELVVTPTHQSKRGVYEVSIKGKEETGKTYALTTPRGIALEDEA